jgi:hypothetical protein
MGTETEVFFDEPTGDDVIKVAHMEDLFPERPQVTGYD